MATLCILLQNWFPARFILGNMCVSSDSRTRWTPQNSPVAAPKTRKTTARRPRERQALFAVNLFRWSFWQPLSHVESCRTWDPQVPFSGGRLGISLACGSHHSCQTWMQVTRSPYVTMSNFLQRLESWKHVPGRISKLKKEMALKQIITKVPAPFWWQVMALKGPGILAGDVNSAFLLQLKLKLM